MKKYYGTAVFMGSTIAFILLFTYLAPEPKQPTQGIPHNYWVPTNKEAIDWTGTTQDEDTMYIDGDHYCDTIYHMSYGSFTEVPAGTTDTIIIVDGILYKMNDNKTQWIQMDSLDKESDDWTGTTQ